MGSLTSLCTAAAFAKSGRGEGDLPAGYKNHLIKPGEIISQIVQDTTGINLSDTPAGSNIIQSANPHVPDLGNVSAGTVIAIPKDGSVFQGQIDSAMECYEEKMRQKISDINDLLI